MNLMSGNASDETIFSKYVKNVFSSKEKGVRWPLNRSFILKTMKKPLGTHQKNMFLSLVYQIDFLNK
jgi:hypothetical protein